MNELRCCKCGTDLDAYVVSPYALVNYCPMCGACVPDKQEEALSRLITDEEAGEMIKRHLLDLLEKEDGMSLDAGGLVYDAWNKENIDGVVFYYNYTADRFVARHFEWIKRAFEHAKESTGDVSYLVEMFVDSSDRFLVGVFNSATEHFVFDQLGVDRNEGDLSEKRIREIKRLVKTVSYDGEF